MNKHPCKPKTSLAQMMTIHLVFNSTTTKKTLEECSKLPATTVKFGTTEIRMLIDSGASVNVIDKTA